MCPSACSRIPLILAGSASCSSSRLSDGARGLGVEQHRELVEREAEQVAEPDDLAHALDVGLAVGAVLALGAVVGAGEQADLLVVADRPRRRAGELGDLSDPERLGCCRAHAATFSGRGVADARASSSCSAFMCDGRAALIAAPSSEIPARHHSAVCMFDMNGTSCAFVMWLARPLKTANRTLFGTLDVTTASTNAIEMTAPVFCTSTRAPAAMPRRCGGTVPIIAAVLGELNMPEPTPDDEHVHAGGQVSRVALQRGHQREPGGLHEHPATAIPREPRRSAQMPASGEAISIPIASGASLIPARIGELPCTPWK